MDILLILQSIAVRFYSISKSNWVERVEGSTCKSLRNIFVLPNFLSFATSYRLLEIKRMIFVLHVLFVHFGLLSENDRKRFNLIPMLMMNLRGSTNDSHRGQFDPIDSNNALDDAQKGMVSSRIPLRTPLNPS